jgi:hypothetical protein
MKLLMQRAVILTACVCLFPGCLSVWRSDPPPPKFQGNHDRPAPKPPSSPPAPKPKPDSQPPDDLTPPVDNKPEKPAAIPVARTIPGRPGFVFSPFNNKPIDVEGFPSGSLVADPHFPRDEKKYFRVP